MGSSARGPLVRALAWTGAVAVPADLATADHLNEMAAAWSRAAVAPDQTTSPGDVEPVVVPVPLPAGADGDVVDPELRWRQFLETASQVVTGVAIEDGRGELLMLHAGGVAGPDGRVVVLVGPSGRGKTTATRTLARDLGYVSDETVAVTRDLAVLPHPKPLSLIVDGGGGIKRQAGPDELGLAPLPDAPLRLHRVVVLDRDPDHAGPALIEPVDAVDVLADLVGQVSYLPDLERPLHRLLGTLAAAGGLRRAAYAEAADLLPLVRDLLAEEPAPPTGALDVPAPLVGPVPADTAADRWTPGDLVDVVDDGDRAYVLSGGYVRVLEGIAPAVLAGVLAGEEDEALVARVVAVHGHPPADPDDPGAPTAETLVTSVLVALANAGIVRRGGDPAS